MHKERYVGFLFPVIDGEIYVGQRGTEPFKGYYGAVGGKNDPKTTDRFNRQHLIYKPGGHQELSIADKIMVDHGREGLAQTAIREFCEEIFQGVPYPEGFADDDFRYVQRLGVVHHQPEGSDTMNHCYFHIAQISRTDFRLSPREIHDFRPLRGLSNDNLFPISRLPLAHLRFMLEVAPADGYAHSKGLEDQIPELDMRGEFISSNMVGAFDLYSRQDLDRAEAQGKMRW